MSTGKVVGWCFFAFIGLIALGFLGEAIGLYRYQLFEPWRESVRRTTYEQTKSYKQGSVQRLGTLCTQAKDSSDPKMLYGVIKQEFAEWSVSDVPDYLQGCLTAARR